MCNLLNVVVIDHDADIFEGALVSKWCNALEKINITPFSLYSASNFDISHINFDCIVLLHILDGRGDVWKNILDGSIFIKRIIVVSTGGHPRTKNIIEDKIKYFWLTKKDDTPLSPDDMSYNGRKYFNLINELRLVY